MILKAVFFATILVSYFDKIHSGCEEKYVTFCDCVSDIQNYKSENWTDLIIDSSKQTCESSVLNSENFETLEEIKLLFVVTSARNIDSDTFKTIGQTLKVLKLYNNNLPQIKDGMFSGFRKLSRLVLSNNRIRSIEGFSFRGSMIKSLDLSHNDLETIPENAFGGSDITQIFIKNNKLSYINDHAFGENLEVLRLDYNHLEYIQKGFINNLPLLKELSFSHNRLSHISDIKALENVEKLDFSFNTINSIHEAKLQDLKKLTYLDLSNNRLETLSLEVFKKVKTERMTLLLSYNLLTNIKMQDNCKPMTLTTFGNPWNCKCLKKVEENMIQYNFTTSNCNLQLLRSGRFPICVEQGECQHTPTENKEDLRRFLRAVNEMKTRLPCDLFREVRPKDLVSVTAP